MKSFLWPKVKKKELEGFGLTPALRTIIECVYYASQPRLTYGVDTMMRDVEKEIANSIAFLEKENENDKASVKKLEETKNG